MLLFHSDIATPFINMSSIGGDAKYLSGWCRNYYQVNTPFLALLTWREHEITGYIVSICRKDN